MALETLGKYELQGVLGRGAAGTVYDARDPVIGRRVAIKTVKLPNADDDETREELERFRREARAAGGLSHPNIVPIFDYGETNQLAYIVMEFIGGGSLTGLLKKHTRLTVPEALRIMEQLLSGLQFSHDKGIVHRDVKPDNVLLRGVTAKLSDFGAALVLGMHGEAAGGAVGSDGELPLCCGTSQYAAPEFYTNSDLPASAVSPPSTGSSYRTTSQHGTAADMRGTTPRTTTTTSTSSTGRCKLLTRTPTRLVRSAALPRADAVASAADVFALGVTLFASVAGVFPWDVADPAVDSEYARWHNHGAWSVIREQRCRARHDVAEAAAIGEQAARRPSSSGSDLGVDGASPKAGTGGTSSSSADSAVSLQADVARGELAEMLFAAGGGLGTKASRPGSLADLVIGMLDPEPSTRLTLDEVAHHAWLSSTGSVAKHAPTHEQ